MLPMKRLAGRRVLTLPGSGDPGSFFRDDARHGIDVREERAFADHSAFAPGEIEPCIAESKRDSLDL